MNVIRARLGRVFAAFAAAAVLAGCSSGDGATGGGGNASPPPPPPEPPPVDTATAEGAYAGTLTQRGFRLSLIVLENGAAWGLYENENNGLLAGFFEGRGVSSNGSYTVDDGRDHDFVDPTTRRSRLSATYFPRVSIGGHLIPDIGVQSAFSATAAAMTGYDYARPASLARIEGNWPGFHRNDARSSTVEITGSGRVSALAPTGCRWSGTVAPRASGRNVFDVRIDFGPAPCELPNGVATGIAIVVDTARGQQLMLAATDVTRSFATAFAGIR